MEPEQVDRIGSYGDSGGTIQGNMGEMYSNVQWDMASFTSYQAANFMTPGAVTTYRWISTLGTTMYGYRTMDIPGVLPPVVLEWTTDWNGGFNEYTLR